jgi:hypothetical protein
MDAGSRIVQAIEKAWRAIQADCPDVPDVVVCTGTGRVSARKAKWGHFWGNRWVIDPEQPRRAPELFVAGELLAESGRRVLQTLIHEAAHGLNHVRGEEGTNYNGRHNLTFVKAATELGLCWPKGEKAHPTIGFSQVIITDETVERYAGVISELESARLAYLTWLHAATTTAGTGTGEGGEAPKRGKGSRGGTLGGKRIKAVCECDEPDAIDVTPARLKRKPIKCGDCDSLYRPAIRDAA